MESSMDINLEVTPIDLKKIPRADDIKYAESLANCKKKS